ncbi:RNA-directed DNA polymerase, eukaryota, reverse transcriptase zinc-binding domain protein [Tanacetum coccineum]
MVDGIWVDNPKSVKREFLDHFSKHFCKPDDLRATLTMEFPNRLHPDQSRDLEMSVSNEEIKKAMWECGTDKAPGPDGFTFGFFRHFWYIVEKDVCNAAKMKQTLISNVFEKAYDSVRWDFLDDVLCKFGFGDKWRRWIQCCLQSSRGSIILNGSPTEEFEFRVVDAGLFHGVKLRDTASGLKINMCKSKILGIHVNNDNISRAAEDLGCQVLKLPFSYLGSMVGGRMHRLHSWDDTVDRVRNRLSKWKMKMLSSGGRLTLVKSVLGSMPIFHMSLFKVPAGILHKLESIRKHFFNGHESSSRRFLWGRSLWARVIKAIHGMDGSIGDIRIGNSKSCWSSIINEINVLSSKGIKLMNYLRITLGNGVSTRLWDEPWHVEGILKDRFPRIYALENCKSVTVGDKLAHQTLSHSFRRLPRGGIENAQFAEFSVLLQQVVLAQGSDRWTWTANGSGQFSVASVRKIIDNKLCSGGENSTRWIRCVPNKINIHAWKVMTESLATRFDISRRGIVIDSILCGNCDIGVETTSHLFFTCDMATSVRRLINGWWEVPDIEIDSYATWKGWIVTIRMASKTKLMFEGVYYVMWWLLWWYRNNNL